MAGLVVLAVFVTWLMVNAVWGARSMTYDVSPAGVTIRFGLSRVQIPLGDILEVRIEEQPSGLRRVVGSNFPGMYQGRWTSATTGTIYLYATSLKPLVVIETADRRYGVSPRETAAFVAAVESGTPGTFEPLPTTAAWGLAALAAIPVLLMIPVLVMVHAHLRIARRVAYELTDDALLIHGPSRPISIPYSEIESVRIESPPGFPLQAGGASVPGFYWGSCTWKAVSRNLRMHATQLRPIVLFNRRRSVYGVSPEQPERFVAELKRRLPKDGSGRSDGR